MSQKRNGRRSRERPQERPRRDRNTNKKEPIQEKSRKGLSPSSSKDGEESVGMSEKSHATFTDSFRSSRGSGRSRGRKRSKQLEDQRWYHGTMPRADVEPLFKEDGEFLVRATVKDEVEVVMSVRWGGRVHHLVVLKDQEGWRLEGPAHLSVYELVRHHYKFRIPLTRQSKIMLIKPIKRIEWLIDHRSFREEELIGAGAFGDVFVGKLKTVTNKDWVTVAIKRCKGKLSEQERVQFLSEAKLMATYRHPNVVRLYGMAGDKIPIRMIMEFCPNGSLDTLLYKKKFGEEQKMTWVREGARGMEYLSSRNCVHRDLAARNCLVAEDLQLKISDFGMSREGIFRIVAQKGVKIPVKWSAPEAMTKGVWSTASDVFSFAVVVWEIFMDGATPWGEAQNSIVHQNILMGLRLEIPPSAPPPLPLLMQQCWVEDPKQRPSFRHLGKEIDHVIRPYVLKNGSLKS